MQLPGFGREIRPAEELRQIIDENVTTQGSDSRGFVGGGLLEKNGRQSINTPITKPFLGRGMQIDRIAKKRLLGSVTDNTECVAAIARAGHEFQGALERLCFIHSRPVGLSLHHCPLVFAILLPQIIPNSLFTGRSHMPGQLKLRGETLEHPVVADNGVIEIDPDQHCP